MPFVEGVGGLKEPSKTAEMVVVILHALFCGARNPVVPTQPIHRKAVLIDKKRQQLAFVAPRVHTVMDLLNFFSSIEWNTCICRGPRVAKLNFI